MSATLIGIGCYIAIQFAIGIWVARRVKLESDYILAGRNVGTAFAAFSIFATWFGAETVIGAAGSVYSDGLSGAQGEPFAYGVAIILMGLLFAVPLRRRGLTTFADLFAQRYGPSVERLVVLLLIPGSILWAAAQIRGFGQIFSSASGVDVTTGIIVAFVAVVAYTMIGGLLADIYTDFVQGIAILAGLIALLVFVLLEAGSPATALAQVDAQRLAIMGPEQSLMDFIEQWAVPICGSLVALELISRLLACRTPGVAQRASFFGGGAYLLVALIPVYIGLIGPSLRPGLDESEQLIPQLAETYLPTFFYVIFAGALISAILSTVDSALLACSAMLSHNLVQHVVPVKSEKGKVWMARGGVAALGTIATYMALTSDSIGDLVEFASAFGTAGVFVVTLFALFTRIGGPISAIATMATGALVWAFSGPLLFDVATPYTFGVVAALITYPLVALVERQWQTHIQ
ncbi:MAG: sodium:solute symporter family protein [Filomicrobium sp.]